MALIAVIASALTPVLSPYRLAADSQFRLVRNKGLAALSEDRANQNAFGRDNPLQYLRFETGRYGVARLQELAALQTGPDAKSVGRLAQQLLNENTRGINPTDNDYSQVLAKLQVYPEGRPLEADLKDRLEADLVLPENGFAFQHLTDRGVAGVYVSLKRDGEDNFVLLNTSHGLVYDKRQGHWTMVGDLRPSSFVKSPNLDLVDQLAHGQVSVAEPAWKELSIGGTGIQCDRAGVHRVATPERVFNCREALDAASTRFRQPSTMARGGVAPLSTSSCQRPFSSS